MYFSILSVSLTEILETLAKTKELGYIEFCIL